jgi:DNA-binding HxlR family transcriptional regulator
MRSYGQFCPVAKTAEVFCQRWNALIIRDLSWGSSTFTELKRGVPMMSPALLTKRLKDLQREGVIERRPKKNGRGYTYHLTEAGLEFAPIIDAMGVWGRRWTRRDLEDDEIDMDLLLWGLESSARFDAFGRVPTVVQIEFDDQPKNRRRWWFLNDDGRCQLCVDDPGHDVDIFLSGKTEDFIHVYLGDIALHRALDSDLLQAVGAVSDIRNLEAWLNPGPLSKIESKREKGVVSD